MLHYSILAKSRRKNIFLENGKKNMKLNLMQLDLVMIVAVPLSSGLQKSRVSKKGCRDGLVHVTMSDLGVFC